VTAVKRLGKYSFQVMPFASHIIETDTKLMLRLQTSRKQTS